jgi:hypothetical protein
LKTKFRTLMKDKVYLAAIETGTSQEANVKNRLQRAEEAFSKVP